jgi:hypothetical protein
VNGAAHEVTPDYPEEVKEEYLQKLLNGNSSEDTRDI